MESSESFITRRCINLKIFLEEVPGELPEVREWYRVMGKINIIEDWEDEVLIGWLSKHNPQFLKFKKNSLNFKIALKSNLRVEQQSPG